MRAEAIVYAGVLSLLPLPLLLAPPRYEESFFASNDIMTGEGDNQYTMGDRKFTPRYPVYEFKPFVMPKNTRMSYYNA